MTLLEAARLICRTPSPSAEQLVRVRCELESGLLQGCRGSKDGWITSEAAVAEYLARQSLHKQRARRSRAAAPAASGNLHSNDEPAAPPTWREPADLKSCYRDILKEYFLAVMLRRRSRTASRGFEQAVIAGQAVLLLTLVGGTIGGFCAALTPAQPQRQAVQRWLRQNVAEHQVNQWFPSQPNPQGTGTLVRVQYRYFTPARKSVDTDRTFLVEGDQVTEASAAP